MSQIAAPTENTDSPRGLAFALTAYVLWGFLPLYMKALSDVPVLEVLAHRVIWSVPVAGLILIWLGRTNDLRVAMGNPRMLAMGALTAALIVCNWGIYVWAVQHGFALDAALGYYINPLVSIGVGAIVLREPLNRLQLLAIALAALAVAVLTWEAGTLPVLALGMTLSWAAYAFAKKQLPIGPNQGFMLEVLILLPVAIGYVIWAQLTGNARFMAGHPVDTVLLACAVAWFARGRPLAQQALLAGLALSSAYLGWSLIAKGMVEREAQRSLAAMGLADAPRFSVPMPFNTLLWRVVAMTPDGFLEGERSLVADRGPMVFRAYGSDVAALEAVGEVPSVRRLVWFNHGFMKARERDGRLELSDLRMGAEPDYTFVFAVAERDGQAWRAAGPEQVRVPWEASRRLGDMWERIWVAPQAATDLGGGMPVEPTVGRLPSDPAS